MNVGKARSITHESARFGIVAHRVNRRDAMAHRQHNELDPPTVEEAVAAYKQRGGVLAYHGGEGCVDFAAGAGVQDLDWESDVLAGRSYLTQVGFRICSVAWIDENSYAIGPRHHVSQQSKTLCGQLNCKKIYAGRVSTWPTEAGDKTQLDRIFADTEHDRNGLCRGLSRKSRRGAARDGNNRRPATKQVGHHFRHQIVSALRPAVFNRHVLPFYVAAFTQAFPKGRDTISGGLGCPGVDHPDHWHRRRLRTRHQRPHRRSPAEHSDELAPPAHSITSSAIASSLSGIWRPSALAVLRLMTSSYLVGTCTGRSAGWVPRRIRSTYEAARMKMSRTSNP